MPKKPNPEGLSDSTIDNITGALEKGFQIFRSLQGSHVCTIVRKTGEIGGDPIRGFAPTSIFNSIYEVEVEIDIFTVEEIMASQGMIKMADKKFEFRVPVRINDIIALHGVIPTDVITEGGVDRAPDFNDLDDCNTINKPWLHGIGIEDDPNNNEYVQYYRIYKVDDDERLTEWVCYGRLLKTPFQDGESPSGNEKY